MVRLKPFQLPTLLVACSRSSDLSLLMFSLPSSLGTSDFQDNEHWIANHSSGTVQESHLLPFTERAAKVVYFFDFTK